MGDYFMATSAVSNENKSTSVAKNIGNATLSVGAGVATYGVANIMTGTISNKFADSAMQLAQNNNELFKDAAKQALKNENIFCTTPNKAFNAFFNMKDIDLSNEANKKELRAFATLFNDDKSVATKINNKIDNFFGKIISKLSFAKKDNGMVEQTKKGLNAMSKGDFVYCDLDNMAMASFHEMGHVKNYQSKGFGKLLQAMRHPLVKKIAIATALLGVILPSNKKDEKDKNALDKTGDFIKDNCVAISALATVPTVLEEGLASVKGAQIAKKVLEPDKLKMLNKANGKAFLTYLIGATLLPLGVYVAKKIRDSFDKPKEQF